MRNHDNNRSGTRGTRENSNRGGGTRQASGGDLSTRQAGHMGGQRERELVQQGKQAEGSGRAHRGGNDR
ncbi:MAG: Em GEA1 (EM1) [Lysobacter sp.]|nr:Em GEA1 (EM1) [Lysobacter sp.]